MALLKVFPDNTEEYVIVETIQVNSLIPTNIQSFISFFTEEIFLTTEYRRIGKNVPLHEGEEIIMSLGRQKFRDEIVNFTYDLSSGVEIFAQCYAQLKTWSQYLDYFDDGIVDHHEI